MPYLGLAQQPPRRWWPLDRLSKPQSSGHYSPWCGAQCNSLSPLILLLPPPPAQRSIQCPDGFSFRVLLGALQRQGRPARRATTSLWPFSPLAFSRRRRTSLNRSRRRSPRRSRRRRREEATIATATTPNDDSLADNGKDNPEDPSNIAAWGAASTYVSSLGPVFAQRVDKLPGRDWYRLRRLLEVVYTVSAKKQKKASQDKSEAVLKHQTRMAKK